MNGKVESIEKLLEENHEDIIKIYNTEKTNPNIDNDKPAPDLEELATMYKNIRMLDCINEKYVREINGTILKRLLKRREESKK